MNSNPFLSHNFKTIWLKHFGNSRSAIFLNFIETLTFVKHALFPVYFNTCETNTKGITYKLSDNVKARDYKKHTVIIYDIPDYDNSELPNSNLKNLGSYKIKQYPGFRCDLSACKNTNDYLLKTISKKSRYKFNNYQKKFDNTIQGDFRVFFGDISYAKYEALFDCFYKLLKKRFDHKKITNNNLNPQEWAFYKEVSFPMILNKEAVLFVIYHKEEPIAITLTYLSKNEMFDVIRVFDIDYSKFRLGVLIIMKQISWCIHQGITYLDFSKGDFEYKKRWANQPYWLEYHIYFDKKSILSRCLAFFYKQFYIFKRVLRSTNIMPYIHRASFFIHKRYS